MASKNQTNATASKTWSVTLHFAAIAWFPELNRARPTKNYGKTDELQTSIAKRGWIEDGDGMVKVEKISDSLRDRAMKERHDTWDGLKSLVKVDKTKAFELSVWEEIFTENGKLRQVDFCGVTGNRRSTVFVNAMMDRAKEQLPLTVMIPAKVETYKNPLERLTAQIEENELKTLGFLQMSDIDCLLSAKEAFQLGASQNDLRKTFTDTTGQKLWGVLKLDQLFPKIEIVNRMSLKPEEDGYLRLKGVKGNLLPELVWRSIPEELQKKREKQKQGETPIRATTEEEVRKFFEDATSGEGGTNLPKIMARQNIQGLHDNNPNRIVKMAAKAIIDNNSDNLKPLLLTSSGFNALLEIVDYGDYPQVEMILLKIVSSGDGRTDLLKRLLAACNPPASNNGVARREAAGATA